MHGKMWGHIASYLFLILLLCDTTGLSWSVLPDPLSFPKTPLSSPVPEDPSVLGMVFPGGRVPGGNSWLALTSSDPGLMA